MRDNLSENEFTPTDRWVCTYYLTALDNLSVEFVPTDMCVCIYCLTVRDYLSDR